jgi:stage III sporulation protein AB
MVKLIGILFVFFSCTGAGIFLAEQKKKRLQSLRNLRQIFMRLQGEIRYGCTPLEEAMVLAAKGEVSKKQESILAIFQNIAKKMEEKQAGSFSGIWQEELLKGSKGIGLTKGDLEKLFRAGEGLGCFDRETILATLACYLTEVDYDIKTEEKSIKEKVRLYHWMGALLGIFICILML